MRIMNTKKYKGMTLVELMVAVLIGVIVIIGASSVIGGGYKSLNKGFKRVSLQRDASYAMYVFSLPIKEATGATIGEEDSMVTIDNRDGTKTSYYLDSTDKELKRRKDENTPNVIIKNVENLGFTLDGNRVHINMLLKKDDLLVDFTSTIMMRNYGL